MVKKKLQNATVAIAAAATTIPINANAPILTARNGCAQIEPIERNVFVPKCKIELYVCAIDTNDQVTNKQILAFNQNDIVPEDIYLLDGKNFVYLWIGSLRLAIYLRLVVFDSILNTNLFFSLRGINSIVVQNMKNLDAGTL